MKTKEIIKEKSRELFNEYGIKNITLREVAKELEKSYGNVTYHFSTKEKLINDLFEDMNKELTELQTMYLPSKNLLEFFLLLPDYSFDITIKYLFFYKDYVEIKRTYPLFFKKVEIANSNRKSKWLLLLIELQKQGFLSQTLIESDLEYIMELSVGIRLFYFQEKEWNEFDKAFFREKVNRLLYPYLSTLGQGLYTAL